MPLWHTPMLLLFPIPPSRTKQAIQAFLGGFQRTLEAIPLLTGSIKAMPNADQKGTLAVTQPWRSVDELFNVRDLQGSSKYSYSNVREKGFPSSLFQLKDYTKLEFAIDPDPPVMYTQVTLIEGGLVLAPLIHHCFTDVTGLASVVRFWAACCRSSSPCKLDSLSQDSRQISRNAFAPENLDAAIEDFPEYGQLSSPQFGKDSSHMRYDTGASGSRNGPDKLIERLRMLHKHISVKVKVTAIRLFFTIQSLNSCTRLIYFPYSSLQELKRSVAKKSVESDSTTWISTMDALSALLLVCVSDSRGPTQGNLEQSNETQPSRLFQTLARSLQSKYCWWMSIDHQKPAELTVAVNARKYCQDLIPSDFIGNVLLYANIQRQPEQKPSSLESVASEAQSLRRKLLNLDSTYVRRNLAALRSVPDFGNIAVAPAALEGRGLVASSWRDEDLCSLDWGPNVGMQCERVRICEFFFDGMVIPFPDYVGAVSEGGLEVFLCLKKSAMKRLESNALFNQYAEWR